MWCVIELNISIIGGNFPTLRPFLRKYVPALLGTSKGRTSATAQTRSGSHQLQSFDPTYTSTAGKGFNKTTITGMDQKTHLGDNESEEYIIQSSARESETDLGRTGQLAAGPLNHPKNGFGSITKTVEYSLSKEWGRKYVLLGMENILRNAIDVWKPHGHGMNEWRTWTVPWLFSLAVMFFFSRAEFQVLWKRRKKKETAEDLNHWVTR